MRILINALYMVVGNVCGLSKTIMFYWKSNEIKDIIDEIDDEKFNPKLNSIKHSAVMESVIKEISTITRIYYSLSYCNLLLFTTLPLYKTLTATDNEKMLPVPIWLPFDYSNWFM